jgi:hypothetical protein
MHPHPREAHRLVPQRAATGRAGGTRATAPCERRGTRAHQHLQPMHFLPRKPRAEWFAGIFPHSSFPPGFRSRVDPPCPLPADLPNWFKGQTFSIGRSNTPRRAPEAADGRTEKPPQTRCARSAAGFGSPGHTTDCLGEKEVSVEGFSGLERRSGRVLCGGDVCLRVSPCLAGYLSGGSTWRHRQRDRPGSSRRAR